MIADARLNTHYQDDFKFKWTEIEQRPGESTSDQLFNQ